MFEISGVLMLTKKREREGERGTGERGREVREGSRERETVLSCYQYMSCCSSMVL